jgi:hypothetical protein
MLRTVRSGKKSFIFPNLIQERVFLIPENPAIEIHHQIPVC